MLANAIRSVRVAVKTTTPILSAVRNAAAYEGDGKTTIRVLNQEDDMGLMINSYATYGFRLNNGVTVLGPMAIFPRSVFSWQVHSSTDITPDSLRFITMLEPKIDLLVLGLESSDRATVATVLRAARACNINAEILPIEHACSTFNFLNSEGRSVAGCLIPPLSVQLNEDDMLRSQLHYNNLYSANIG